MNLSRILLYILFAVFIFDPTGSLRAQDIDKLDPTLKLLLAQPDRAVTPEFAPLTKIVVGDTSVDIFIRTLAPANFNIPGMQIKSVLGDIVVASVPILVFST
ncbi:MAG: hypothetical protein FJY97_13430 [candidate division Zixibacteria bacterium]|nr:hypothetical protein [candidate division Zixibacteria bacterium]